MKPRPRIRKTIKWTSAVMVVVLMAAWAVALVYFGSTSSLLFAGQSGGIGFSSHRFTAAWFGPGVMPVMADLPRWFRYIGDTGFEGWSSLWFDFRRSSDQVWIDVPYWIPMLACGVTWAVLWRRDKRLSNVERGGCVKCGYDRAGLAAGTPCPECGARP